MHFENSCVIPVATSKLWDYLIVIPNVAGCLPGVQEIETVKDGEKYTGVVTQKIGPVSLKLKGKLTIEFMDVDRYAGAMKVEAADQRISGLIQGTIGLKLEELAAAETKLTVSTNLMLLGKIGEFGQPIIQKKAALVIQQFAENLAKKILAADETPGA
jgi:carbon monoxide dehydrogenase subunit G